MNGAKRGKREKDEAELQYFCFLIWRGCREACVIGRLDRNKKILPILKKLLTIYRSYIRAEDIGRFL
jgi:hypothetical protein